MKIHNLIQGTSEWQAHRAKHWNASEASAMLGCSPHKTRTQLLDEYATGLVPEVDDFLQGIYDNGHRFEALARPIAEGIMATDLYPVVGTEGTLSASFDGLALDQTEGFEHKWLNANLRTVMVEGCDGTVLPLHHKLQMEQECMVSGATRMLFMASEWDRNGVLIEERHCWYTPDPALRKKILAGWDQFNLDLSQHVVQPKAAPAPTAQVISALPALVVHVTGEVTSSNLDVFALAATKFIEGINTTLETDQDFADAAETVKFCQSGEDRLDLVKEQALGQTATIEELFTTIDKIKEQLRQKRLTLNKLVDKRKADIKVEIVTHGQQLVRKHIDAMNARLGAPWITSSTADFNEAVKNKRGIDTMREAVSVVVANTKIALNELADRLDANRKSLVIDGKDWFFLFADFAVLGAQQAETFNAIASQRIQRHKDEEAAAEARRAAAAVPVPAPAPVAAPAVAVRSGGSRKGEAPPMATGDLFSKLGVAPLTAELIKSLGFESIPSPKATRTGTYWRADDLLPIARALANHILTSATKG